MGPNIKTSRILLLVMVVMVLLPASYLGTAAANGNAAIQALIADPMALLAMRSAGRRGAGALAQSKMAYAVTDTPPGDFLGLSPEPDLPSVGGGSSPVPPPTSEPVSEVPPVRDQMSFLSPPGFDDAPGSGIFPGGFGGHAGDDFAIGGGGVAPSLPGASGLLPAAPPALVQPLVPPLVPSPVPEPGTWLMMIAGFLAVGSALRSRHRSKVSGSADTIGPTPTGER